MDDFPNNGAERLVAGAGRVRVPTTLQRDARTQRELRELGYLE